MEQYNRNIHCLIEWGDFAKLRKATISLVMSVCPSIRPPERNNSAPTGRIFMKIYICGFFENLYRKILHYYLARMKGTLHEDRHIYFFISCSILLRMRNVSDKRCRESQTRFVLCTFSSKIVPFMRKCGKIL
jgi:hypothetical protein